MEDEMGQEYDNTHTYLVGKPEGKRQLGKPMNIWENNNKIDIKEIGTRVVNCISLIKVRDKWWDLTNTVMNLPVLTG
jgi:hypothetical protein